jgi:hypothetical protein
MTGANAAIQMWDDLLSINRRPTGEEVFVPRSTR